MGRALDVAVPDGGAVIAMVGAIVSRVTVRVAWAVRCWLSVAMTVMLLLEPSTKATEVEKAPPAPTITACPFTVTTTGGAPPVTVPETTTAVADRRA